MVRLLLKPMTLPLTGDAMNPRRLTAITLAALTAIGLTACSSIQDKVSEVVVEKAIEAGGGGKVDIDVDDSGDGTVSIDTGEGTVTIGGTDLPAGWPSAVQIPKDQTVTGSFSAQTAEGLSATVTTETTSSTDDAIAAAQKTLESGGFTPNADVTDMRSDGDVLWMASATDGSLMLAIQVIGSADDATMVNYIVSPKTD